MIEPLPRTEAGIRRPVMCSGWIRMKRSRGPGAHDCRGSRASRADSTGSRTDWARPTMVTDQPAWDRRSNSSISKATIALRVAAASLLPWAVRMMTLPSSMRKLTGWTAGIARSVKTILPIGIVAASEMHSSGESTSSSESTFTLSSLIDIGRARTGAKVPRLLGPWVVLLMEARGQSGRLGTPLHTQLGEQAGDVVLHRLLGDEQPLADLPVGQPLADEFEYPPLL